MKEQLTIFVEPEVLKEVFKLADKQNRTTSYIINEILEKKFKLK